MYSEKHTKKPTLRTCLSCRKQESPERLVRLVQSPDKSLIKVDYLGKIPGHGAYLCPNPKCFQKSTTKGGLNKAFKTKLTVDSKILLQEAIEASERQICSLLSLANRAGAVLSGNSRVKEGMRLETGTLLLLARDASEGVKKKFQNWAERTEMPQFVMLSKQQIGPSVGKDMCSLILLTDLGFSRKLGRELLKASTLVPKKLEKPTKSQKIQAAQNS